eukprot:UN28966
MKNNVTVLELVQAKKLNPPDETGIWRVMFMHLIEIQCQINGVPFNKQSWFPSICKPKRDVKKPIEEPPVLEPPVCELVRDDELKDKVVPASWNKRDPIDRDCSNNMKCSYCDASVENYHKHLKDCTTYLSFQVEDVKRTIEEPKPMEWPEREKVVENRSTWQTFQNSTDKSETEEDHKSDSEHESDFEEVTRRHAQNILEMDLFEWIEKTGPRLFPKKFQTFWRKYREVLEDEEIDDVASFRELDIDQIKEIFPKRGSQNKIKLLVKELNKESGESVQIQHIQSPVQPVS